MSAGQLMFIVHEYKFGMWTQDEPDKLVASKSFAISSDAMAHAMNRMKGGTVDYCRVLECQVTKVLKMGRPQIVVEVEAEYTGGTDAK